MARFGDTVAELAKPMLWDEAAAIWDDTVLSGAAPWKVINQSARVGPLEK